MVEQRIKRIEKALGINEPDKVWTEKPVVPVSQEVMDYRHSKGQAVPILGGLSGGTPPIT